MEGSKVGITDGVWLGKFEGLQVTIIGFCVTLIVGNFVETMVVVSGVLVLGLKEVLQSCFKQ